MNKYALDIINKLVKDRYKDAAAIFFFSSASDESGSDLSALDLVIIYIVMHICFAGTIIVIKRID